MDLIPHSIGGQNAARRRDVMRPFGAPYEDDGFHIKNRNKIAQWMGMPRKGGAVKKLVIANTDLKGRHGQISRAMLSGYRTYSDNRIQGSGKVRSDIKRRERQKGAPTTADGRVSMATPCWV
jgi:hypothetical protein